MQSENSGCLVVFTGWEKKLKNIIFFLVRIEIVYIFAAAKKNIKVKVQGNFGKSYRVMVASSSLVFLQDSD